jgi:hypothetical protein
MHGNLKDKMDELYLPGIIAPLILSYRDRADKIVDFKLANPYTRGVDFARTQQIDPEKIRAQIDTIIEKDL